MDKKKIIVRIEKEIETFKAQSDNWYRDKLLSIKDVLNGKSVKEASIAHRVNKSNIYRWIKKIKQEDWESIFRDRGRTEILTDEQLKELEEILQLYATQFGYITFHWTSDILADFIFKKWDIVISERKCRDILHLFQYKTTREKILNDPMDFVDELSNVWYILSFEVWRKRRKNNKKIVIQPKEEDLIFYMALNNDKKRILLRESRYKKYNNLKKFIEEILNYYMTNEIVLVMRNSAENKKLIRDIKNTDLKGKKVQVALYNISKETRKETKQEVFKMDRKNPDIFTSSNRYYWDYNPLYDLQFEIQKIIKNNRKHFINKVTKNIREKIKELIKEAGYDLY